jgi:hypothetical protein
VSAREPLTVRRGERDDEIELTDQAGYVVILHAHGIGIDEQRRMRERALLLLTRCGIPGVDR